MKIYQVDMRNGDANYAYLTLYLFTKSEDKPTKSQIDKCLSVAKYCQQKGFDNETIRPRITAD